MRKSHKKLIVGSVHPTKNSGDIIVTAYGGSNNVDAMFVDTGFKVHTHAHNIRSGSIRDKSLHLQTIKRTIKDPLRPRVFGVGFIGVGPYSRSDHLNIYAVWNSMLARCYSEKRQLKSPTYVGCTVDKEWHNFQNFAEWYLENCFKGCHVDKDIKIKGNRIYSPRTCMMATPLENSAESSGKTYTMTNPIGENVTFYNMNQFARDNDLTSSALSSVYNGRGNHHKGWTRAQPY